MQGTGQRDFSEFHSFLEPAERARLLGLWSDQTFLKFFRFKDPSFLLLFFLFMWLFHFFVLVAFSFFFPLTCGVGRRAVVLGEMDGFLDETFPGVNERLLSRELNEFSHSFRRENPGANSTVPPNRCSHETPVTSRADAQGSGRMVVDRFRSPDFEQNLRERVRDVVEASGGQGVSETVEMRPAATSSSLRDPVGERRTPRPSVTFADERSENRSELSLGPPPSVYRPGEEQSTEQTTAQVVLVQRDGQIKRFGGCPRNDPPYDEWETEARIVLESLGIRSDSNQAVSLVVGALTGDARREVLSSDVNERRDAEGIFNILSSAFGELRHPVDLQRELFSLVQAPNETVQRFGTSLKVLWQKTKLAHQNYAMPFTANDAMLNGLFVRGIFQPALRQAAISFERDNPGISFVNLRREVMIRSASVLSGNGNMTTQPTGVGAGRFFPDQPSHFPNRSGNRRWDDGYFNVASYRGGEPREAPRRYEPDRNRFSAPPNRNRFASPRGYVDRDRSRFQHSQNVGQQVGFHRPCPANESRPRWVGNLRERQNPGNHGMESGNGRYLSR